MTESPEATKAQEQLILAASGSSFKTREAAENSMKQRKFNNTTHEVIQVDDGGFALKERPPAPEEEYYVVRFSAKASKSDSDDVQLTVNGETLLMQREKEVIVPERFLECADHATFNQYKSVPGQALKVTSKIKTYPYERIRKSTEKEYRKAKNAGTKTSRAHIKKHGYDVTPEDIEE